MHCTYGKRKCTFRNIFWSTYTYEYVYPTRNKTKQCNSKSCENKASITVSEPVPPFTLLVAYKLHTWMGNKDKGGVVPEEQSWALPCFFFSKHFSNFENPFVHCAHVRAVFCHLHVPPLTPTHKLTQEKSWNDLAQF